MLGDPKETVMKSLALVLALLVAGALPAHADPEANKKANPGAPDGIEGFKAFIAMRKEKTPNAKSEIKRAFAEGDYVILHVHSVRAPDERGVAIVDIFRLENGKIVEHWDVVQSIPEKTANSNGMF